MKKKIMLPLLLLMLLTLLAACSSAQAPTTEPASEPAHATENAAETEPVAEEPAPAPSYKDTMLPYDQMPTGSRIIMLQNTLNFSREGIYSKEDKPVTEDIEYNGATISAYSISYPIALLQNGLTGTVDVMQTDGTSLALAAEDFAAMYVILEFDSGEPPLLYNPGNGSEIVGFAYAITEGGEAIYSVVSDSIHNATELIATVGWPTDVTYRYVATDKFYIPVPPEENSVGEVRGALSGAINASFPTLNIASGKINDVIYIETMEE